MNDFWPKLATFVDGRQNNRVSAAAVEAEAEGKMIY